MVLCIFEESSALEATAPKQEQRQQEHQKVGAVQYPYWVYTMNDSLYCYSVFFSANFSFIVVWLLLKCVCWKYLQKQQQYQNKEAATTLEGSYDLYICWVFCVCLSPNYFFFDEKKSIVVIILLRCVCLVYWHKLPQYHNTSASTTAEVRYNWYIYLLI